MVWIHRSRSERCRVKPSGNRKHRIANNLGFKPSWGEPPIKAVRRIGLEPFGIRCRGLLIGRGGHNQGVDVLEAPTRTDKLSGQPFEQFRMGGAVPLYTKVVDRGGKAPDQNGDAKVD